MRKESKEDEQTLEEFQFTARKQNVSINRLH